MTTENSTTAHPERFAFPRLLVRSALLGAVVPVTKGEFWEVKVLQIVSAVVLCVDLYCLEKAVRYPFRKRLLIKPLHSAAYRGALLYGLLSFSGDWAGAMGAAVGGALFAMLLFWLENALLRVMLRTPPASAPPEGGAT
jgi:purine-cytosine permease-like protein